MATKNQKSNHVTRVRQLSGQLLDAVEQLNASRAEWDALNLSSGLTADDMTGENAGLTPEQIAAVYTTLAAINTLMAAGHATNLYAVKL